jgi:hypothetical protein
MHVDGLRTVALAIADGAAPHDSWCNGSDDSKWPFPRHFKSLSTHPASSVETLNRAIHPNQIKWLR